MTMIEGKLNEIFLSLPGKTNFELAKGLPKATRENSSEFSSHFFIIGPYQLRISFI